MTQSIKGNSITLTRGDTFKATVTPLNQDGTVYEMQPGDELRFAMKKDYSDDEPCLLIDIPPASMLLTIGSNDTKDLEFGDYVYDIQLTHSNGEVDTFIAKQRLRLTEEVD